MKATPRARARGGDRMHQLRISLDGIEPAIWRRVLRSRFRELASPARDHPQVHLVSLRVLLLRGRGARPMNSPSQIPAARSASRPTEQRTAVNLAGVQCTIEADVEIPSPRSTRCCRARVEPMRWEPEMSRVFAAVAAWRGMGAALAPYVLLAVIVPGGMAIAPLLYWRNRKRA